MNRSLSVTAVCVSLGISGWLISIAFAPLSATEANAQESSQAQNSAGVLFEEPFDNADLTKRGWYDGDRFTIAKGKPRAGAGCLEFAWPANSSKPGNSTGIRRLFDGTETVSLRFFMRLSRDWGWTGKPYHPHLIQFLTTENGKYHGPAASHLTVYVEPWNGKLRLAAQDIQNKDKPHGLTQGPIKGGYNGRMYDSKDVLFQDQDDEWHCVEAQFQLNTLDLAKDKPNADGIIRGWFDGRLVIERTDVVFRSTDFPKMKFNQFLLLPYFGPGLLPHAQTMWIDELAVGTKRLGTGK